MLLSSVCVFEHICICAFLLQLSRQEITLQQLRRDLSLSQEQYKNAVEENGRLEARIQAFTINAQSEQDVLSSEVCGLVIFQRALIYSSLLSKWQPILIELLEHNVFMLFITTVALTGFTCV